MSLIYHYTRFETFMSYILPTGSLRTCSLRNMNDPRESSDWSFGSINFPYEEIFKGYYSDKTHIECQFKYGNMIKDGYQVLCFTGAKSDGWNNEMMWAHYGGLHSGVCLEFDEHTLLDNLKKSHPDLECHLENVEYSNRKKSSFLHWQGDRTQAENMKYILKYLLKDMTLLKSPYWEKEDERRLVCLGIDEPLYIPIENALKTVYLGMSSNRSKEFVNSIYTMLNNRFNLSLLIYQNNRFERWGIRTFPNGEISTCDFDNINK